MIITLQESIPFFYCPGHDVKRHPPASREKGRLSRACAVKREEVSRLQINVSDGVQSKETNWIGRRPV